MNFSITSKLNKHDYTKTMFIGLYKKPAFILCTIVGIYLITTVLLDYPNAAASLLACGPLTGIELCLCA